jgi:hypothetical protein
MDRTKLSSGEAKLYSDPDLKENLPAARLI